MRITITGLSDEIWSQELTSDLDVATMKMLYCADVQQNPNNVILMVGGNPIRDELKTISEVGITEDEIIFAVENIFAPSRGGSASRGASPQRPQGPRTLESYIPGARGLLQKIDQDREILARFDNSWKGMADACRKRDLNEIARLLKMDDDKKLEEQERLRNAYANPNDPSNRDIIQQHENQKLIDESLALAMEENPEMFGTVIMLYINCRINGQHIKGFVDSGAQMTIMSSACARKCDLMRLVDSRFSGMAQGVGTQKILGRVHTGQIQIENDFIASTFSIMEDQPMDLIIGLDLLKRHQCNIDLMNNQLVIGSTGTRTSFLAENELPKHARLTQKSSQAELQDIEDMEIQNALEASRADQPGPSSKANKPLPATPIPTKVRQVMDMVKCDREIAEEVLEESGGDPNAAALKLLTSGVARSQPRKRSRNS